ncbi:elongation factor P [Candidatus Microgenomates bacterium]|nr:elongation factor P [Candidatus Microgenomates bacterium]
MINASDLKNGVTFLHNGQPFKVIKYNLVKMGRGGATVKVHVRNLETGSVNEFGFSSNVKVESVSTNKRALQYLYNDGSVATFMDPESYEQVEIPTNVLSNELAYIKEGEKVDVLFWGEKALSVDIAPKVTLTVAETDPGVKGNSVSNLYKSATLENGLQTKVPLFIKIGDKIRVDTRTGEYVERAEK